MFFSIRGRLFLLGRIIRFERTLSYFWLPSTRSELPPPIPIPWSPLPSKLRSHNHVVVDLSEFRPPLSTASQDPRSYLTNHYRVPSA